MSHQEYTFLPFFLREPVYLIPEPEPVKESDEPTVPEIPYVGKGQRKVLILVSAPDHKFLAPDDQAFLEKILQAISFTLDDILLVNLENLTTHLQRGFYLDELLATLSFQTCLVLGEVPDQWSLSHFFEKYTIKERNDRQLLQTDTLSAMADDVNKKARLWKCLRQLFVAS